MLASVGSHQPVKPHRKNQEFLSSLYLTKYVDSVEFARALEELLNGRFSFYLRIYFDYGKKIESGVGVYGNDAVGRGRQCADSIATFDGGGPAGPNAHQERRIEHR
jgi:hypothetical protein